MSFGWGGEPLMSPLTPVSATAGERSTPYRLRRVVCTATTLGPTLTPAAGEVRVGVGPGLSPSSQEPSIRMEVQTGRQRQISWASAYPVQSTTRTSGTRPAAPSPAAGWRVPRPRQGAAIQIGQEDAQVEGVAVVVASFAQLQSHHPLKEEERERMCVLDRADRSRPV